MFYVNYNSRSLGGLPEPHRELMRGAFTMTIKLQPQLREQ
jgi:hypothetical protein